MNIRIIPIVSDLRIIEAAHVSRERGRSRIKEMERQGLIKPLRTPTGRTLLSFEDAEIVAEEL